MGVESFSTDDVAFHRRIDYWQDVVTGSRALRSPREQE